MKKPTWCRFFIWWVSSATSLRCGNCPVVTLHPTQPRPFGVRPQFPQRLYQNKKPTTRVSFGMWELLDCRVASATTSSLRDRLRRPARAVLAGGLAGRHSLASEWRSGLQTARKCCLFNALLLNSLHGLRRSQARSSAARIPCSPHASASPLQIVLHTSACYLI